MLLFTKEFALAVAVAFWQLRLYSVQESDWKVWDDGGEV